MVNKFQNKQTKINTNIVNVMAELHLIGEITSATGFGNDSLFCRYSVQAGSNWKVIQGNTEGQTAADIPLFEGESVWSHPINIYYSSKGIQGWPKIQLQVHCLDYVGRTWLKGYSFCPVPTTPGFHSLVVTSWVPNATSAFERLSQHFLGGANQLLTPDYLNSGRDRYKLKTTSAGDIKLNLTVLLKNFDKFGVEYK